MLLSSKGSYNVINWGSGSWVGLGCKCKIGSHKIPKIAFLQMSRVMRKFVFGVSDLVRSDTNRTTATEDGYRGLKFRI